MHEHLGELPSGSVCVKYNAVGKDWIYTLKDDPDYNVNDSFTITPGFAFAMPATSAASIASGSDDLAFYLYDRTAIGVGATFKF